MTRLDATTLVTRGKNPIAVIETPLVLRTRRLVDWAANGQRLIQVVGPSGTGKTTATVDAAVEVVNRSEILAARVATPDRPAPRTLALTLLEQITGVRSTDSLDNLEAALAHELRANRYLVIIDEAQNLNVRGLERIRSLWERAPFGGVLVGDSRLARLMEGSPQLESRIDRRITFEPLHGRALFDFIRQLEPLLAEVDDKSLARVARRVCRGNLRRWQAWLEALREIYTALGCTGAITEELLDAASKELG